MTNKEIANTIIVSNVVIVVFATLNITGGLLVGIVGLIMIVAWIMAIIRLYQSNNKDWLIYVFSISIIIYFTSPKIWYLALPAFIFSILSVVKLYNIQKTK